MKLHMSASGLGFNRSMQQFVDTALPVFRSQASCVAVQADIGERLPILDGLAGRTESGRHCRRVLPVASGRSLACDRTTRLKRFDDSPRHARVPRTPHRAATHTDGVRGQASFTTSR
jgi:hypothetical protein